MINIKSKNVSMSILLFSSLFLAFRFFTIAYINSSFIENVVGRNYVGLIFSISSILSIISLILIPKGIKKIGTMSLILILSIIDIFFLFLISENKNILGVIILIFDLSIYPLLLLLIDTVIEDKSSVMKIGRIRAFFLTILGTSSVLAPLAIGSIAFENNLGKSYLVSAIFMIIFLFFSFTIRNSLYTKGVFSELSIKNIFKEFYFDKNLRMIGFAHFTLQLFFSWMIIYVPLMLKDEGFLWNDIGMIIGISLLPFMLLEIPSANLAENKIGIKKMLFGGIIIASISLLFIPNIKGSIIMATLALLGARTGASIMETMLDEYFYVKIKKRDELISIWRIITPFSFSIGSLIGIPLIKIFGITYMFPILSCLLLFSIIYIRKLEELK